MKREEIWHEQRRWLTVTAAFMTSAIVVVLLGVIAAIQPRVRVVTKVERVVVKQPADVSPQAKVVCAEAGNDQILRRDRKRLTQVCADLTLLSLAARPTAASASTGLDEAR